MTGAPGRRRRLAALTASGWFQASVTAVLALALAGLALRLWLADLRVPFGYDGDALQYLMYAKAIHDHGWLLENGSLGAPFGLFMHDWAEGGWPSLLGVRLLDALLGDWVLAFNGFYLAGYALAALACLWALRRLGVAPQFAIVLSVLYALLPYHLDRGVNHYILSLYYGLPALLSYAITTAAGRPPIPLRRGHLSGRRWAALAAGAVLAGVLAGLMSAYYVAFAGLLLVAAMIFGWLRQRRLEVLVSGVLLCAVVGGTFIVQYAPVLAYRLQHGTNSDVAQRYLGEVENYPLKPADLLLPVPHHPLGPLASLRARYAGFASPAQPGLALGALGSIGLLATLGAFVAAAAGRRRGALPRRLAPIGWLNASAIAIGVLGGGATLLSFAVGPYLRAWDRIAIAIAFLALAGLGLALGLLGRRIRRSWRGPTVAGLATLVLIGGAFDQAATPAWVPSYATLAQRWHADAQLVGRAEALLAPGAMVYTLPFITFPETRRGALGSNDLLRGYLHSRDLRWSAGFIKGRDPGWQVVQAGAPLPARLELIRALGFSGLYVDRLGYPEPGELQTADQLMAELGGLLGPPAAESADGRLAFFVLGDGQVDASVARDALDPVWMRWASGFDLMYQRDRHITHNTRARAAVELRSDRSADRPVLVRFELLPLSARPTVVEVRWPDGTAQTLALNGQPLVHARQLMLPAGRSEIRFVVGSAQPRAFAYTLSDLAVVDASLVHLLDGLR